MKKSRMLQLLFASILVMTTGVVLKTTGMMAADLVLVAGVIIFSLAMLCIINRLYGKRSYKSSATVNQDTKQF